MNEQRKLQILNKFAGAGKPSLLKHLLGGGTLGAIGGAATLGRRGAGDAFYEGSRAALKKGVGRQAENLKGRSALEKVLSHMFLSPIHTGEALAGGTKTLAKKVSTRAAVGGLAGMSGGAALYAKRLAKYRRRNKLTSALAGTGAAGLGGLAGLAKNR